MRKLIIGFIILSSIPSFGQVKDSNISKNEVVIGKNLLTGTDIKAVQYRFPERIHETFIDTTSGLLTLQLRGLSKNGKWLNNKGNIIQYDLNHNQLLWSKKIAYQTSSLQQFGNTIIYTNSNKSYFLDARTGNENWELKNDMYYVDPTEHIGIGYKSKNPANYSNELEGIDLKNGQVKWSRELNREYGWNDLFYINDSTIVVASDGLHAIDINTGEGWNYSTITGKKDYKSTIVANTAGVALGILTGTFVTSSGHDVVRDLVSNVIRDSSAIYFASKEQIAKIDKQSGDVIWNTSFPKDIASKSSIIMNDSLIFMINKGYGFMGYRQLDFGKPFIAAYNRINGKQNFLTIIERKDDPILDFLILDDKIYLVFKNRIAEYSSSSGNLIIEKDYSNNEFGDFKYFVSNNVFFNDGEKMVNLTNSDSSKTFIYTEIGNTLAIDDQLNVQKKIEFKDLGIYSLDTKNHKFIAKDDTTFIIDNDGKKLAELQISPSAFIVGNTLYDRQDANFIEVPIDEIINKL